ncbi:MAG: hypothetical protein KA184_15860, partial [Candidatus Hydrogenedentes bacterium]|nr:hypothetical protein [Candidatus Hydrogenedentota bacterium]
MTENGLHTPFSYDDWGRTVTKSGTVPSERVFESVLPSFSEGGRDGTVPNFVQHVEVWRGLPGEDMTRILSGAPAVIPAQAGTQDTTLPAVIPAQAGTQDTTPPPSFPRKREPRTQRPRRHSRASGNPGHNAPTVIPAQAGTQDTTPPPSFPRKREPRT